MTGRSEYQQTLLGDDAGSRIAWSLYMDGYQRGVTSGYEAGYDAAMRVLDEAGALLASYEVWRHPSRAEIDKRAAERAAHADQRTGEQLRADASASWALTESAIEAA